jgi:hypothetical protein
MDFNTGSSGGRPDDQSRPLYGEETGGTAGDPPRGPAASPAGEFSLQDPVGSFISTTRGVVLSPVNFFRSIARRGDFINPLLYALICALIAAFLGGLLGLLGGLLFAVPGDDTGAALTGGLIGGVAGILFNLILLPIFTVIVLFVGAAITHLLVMLLVRPTNAGFEATFRAGAYIQALQLISWIPIVNFIAFIWAIVLYIFGIREVHNTTTGRAVAIVLIPVAVVLLLVLILGALIGAALFFGAQQQQF